MAVSTVYCMLTGTENHQQQQKSAVLKITFPALRTAVRIDKVNYRVASLPKIKYEKNVKN